MRKMYCYITEITFLFGSKCNLELSDSSPCGSLSTLVCLQPVIRLQEANQVKMPRTRFFWLLVMTYYVAAVRLSRQEGISTPG